jgi:Ca-activated chloride channel family protein
VKNLRLAAALLLVAGFGAAFLRADGGILVPTNLQQPNPNALTMSEMAVDITIEDGDARVLIRQVYASHVGQILEGKYTFALPGRATISDFAVWDGVTRIPGVILERKRAEEIYKDLKYQSIDPGLLKTGEDEAEGRRSAVFSAEIVPIPSFGSKRVEIEYHQTIPVDELASVLAVPLKPDAYQQQTVGHFWITLELHSSQALKDFQIASKAYGVQIREQNPHLVRATFEARNVNLTEDFSVRYAFDTAASRKLDVIAHRDSTSEPGFFQASGLLSAAAAPASADARTMIVLFDNSLSMQWEKLERSFQALDGLLHALRPADRFNVLMFNSEVETFQPAPMAASPQGVQQALDWVRQRRLRGGTNLEAALQAGVAQAHRAAVGEVELVLLTDGGATRGTIATGKLSDWYAKQNPPRTCVWAVGDDANSPLLTLLSRNPASNPGFVEAIRSTEPAEFPLRLFLSKVTRKPVEGLNLAAAPAGNFMLIYPLEETRFPGSLASWIGEYQQPGPATFGAGPLQGAATLPATSADHPQLPRTWAAARVKALLEKIERDGEDRETIDEIIRLSRKYKFVTPYTSFLAAPRALLRPRLIRPGDPVLRVHTDSEVAAVTALFPFGLVKTLRYLPGEDVWQTRFLAPLEMSDGTYWVRLILRDRQGHVYRERKSFVIASQPPVVRVKLDKPRYRAGETMRLRVSASKNTRTVIARMYGAAAVELRWDAQSAANTGELGIPAGLPPGNYVLTVTAEDIAHNIGSQEVRVDVLP